MQSYCLTPLLLKQLGMAMGSALGMSLADLAVGADSALLRDARSLADPSWRMPLFEPYRDKLKSPIADMNNVGDSPQGGAITAALYLKAFVEQAKAWAHIDLYAWNDADRPGRPKYGLTGIASACCSMA